MFILAKYCTYEFSANSMIYVKTTSLSPNFYPASKIGIPCRKVFFSSNIVMWRIIRRVLEHWTRKRINFENFSIDTRKTVHFAFEKFPNFKAFLLPVQSIFKIYKKWFDICVQCLNARFLKRHKAILKKEI